MSDRKQNKGGPRKGAWDIIETIEDPESKVGLVLSERIRGKPGYSMQIIHTDDIGVNKHVPMNPPGATHELKHIVYSLVQRAQEIIDERKKSG